MRKQVIPIMFALAILSLQSADAQDSGMKTFPSPQAASETLFRTVQKDDQKSLEAILGKELVTSGKESEDKLEHQRFAEKYQQMHRLVQEPDGRTVLYIGAENWPFPVPLVSENGKWHFDPEAGMKEILFRRIGENETTAFTVARLATKPANSTNSKKPDTTDLDVDDAASKFAATLRNPSGSSSGDMTFHGYCFVKKPSADKAKKSDQVVLIAYPAEYRSSGVVTFFVTANGSVYEADLGEDTPKVAPTIAKRAHSGWYPAE